MESENVSHNPRPRVALVTGAAKRVGRAVAADLAARGWSVALHYNQSQDEAEDALDFIEAIGGHGAAFQADLADFDQVAALVPRVASELGPVSCLVNNAALFKPDRLGTLTQESWEQHHAINLRAPLFLSQAMAEGLRGDASGVIVNMIDQRVWKLTPEFTSYTLAKAGLWTATKVMAQALAPRIRVNAIAPGPTLPNERQSEDDFAAQVDATLLQRGPELEEICGAIGFILDSPSMTGQMIALDGGQHLLWQTPDVRNARE